MLFLWLTLLRKALRLVSVLTFHGFSLIQYNARLEGARGLAHPPRADHQERGRRRGQRRPRKHSVLIGR